MSQLTQHATRNTQFTHYAIWAPLVLVLGLTIGLRWFRFTTFPPSLWYDEAYTLAQGQRLAQDGEFHIYYPEKHGEPAIIWLTALALKLGAGHLAPRWVSSTGGVISVLLLFLAVRDVMRHQSEHADWIAVGSAAVLGTNYEFLFHTRMSWQAALVTPFFTVATWFFWRGMRDGRSRNFIVAGMMTGAAQYTGVAARTLPLALLLVLLGWARKDPHRWRARWKGILVAGGAALLVYAPLINAFLTHPHWFNRRLQTAAPPSDLLSNLGRTLAGWLCMGEVALHSLPGRPIYDPAMVAPLLIGAVVAGMRIRRPSYNVWLAWFLGVLPGGFLSQPTPMFYRVTPAVPATAALCAIGGWRTWRFVTGIPGVSPSHLRRAALALLLVIFGTSVWATYRDYFVRWANWPRLPMVMDVWKWRAAEVILDSPADENLLVTIPTDHEPALSYAMRARTASPVRAFDGAHCLVYPTHTTRPLHYLSILGYEHRSLPRLHALFPSGHQTTDPLFEDEAPYFVNFFVPRGAKVPVVGKLPAPIRYQNLILLHGVQGPQKTLSPGQSFTVTLTWEIIKPTTNNYVVFVHLLDGRPAASDAPLKAQHDGVPCDATEPTWHWQTGEYILDEHSLTVPADTSPGEYLLGVGLYDADTLERLPPTGEDLNVRWNEAILGSIMVVTP